MPSSAHPQAKFDPIPPDLDLHGLVERTPNLKWAQRVSRAQIRSLGHQEFEKLVLIHVVVGGKPLIIEGWDAALPKRLFNADWLQRTYDKKQENVRDIAASSDIPMTMGHYLRSMKQLTKQWTPNNFRDERRQRLYLKDIDCPTEWRDVLQKVIHPSLFYLNENVSKTGGDRDSEEDVFRSEPAAAAAGDLMSSLPQEMRAENLMCYIGHEGTFTPAHREMCASVGQNIMVEASGDKDGEKPGSSVWFMTESKDREVVREYFLSMLGHDIEIEKHFAQINAWKKAPFDVYMVEQRPGDFIIIPPLAAHQVWNRGTRTMKVAWNRTTPETLDLALHEALPKARLVCRDEQYKNKAIIYFTLQKYYAELQPISENTDSTQMGFIELGQGLVRNSPRAKQLASDFKKLFALFTEILVGEIFAFKVKEVEFLPFDSCVTCSYCRSNIFNRFLTCKHCIRTLVNGDEDAYDVCMECYAMGRSCACLSGLQWVEQWSWPELVDSYETWREMVILNDGFLDVENSPQPLEVARRRSGKKSLAQICQEGLRRRPWKDITKPELDAPPSDSEPGEDGAKAKKPKRKKKRGELSRCHVCSHKDYNYRIQPCSNPDCSEGYCYGVLYRAFDMMPQTVQEDENWQCPKCLGICNCGYCRRMGNANAYTPKNTSLGHDTRPIADDRSVEALVDFRIHNLSWLKATGEESRSKDSRRMQRLREQANSAKAQVTSDQVDAEQANGDVNGEQEVVDETKHDEAGNGTLANGYGDQSHVIVDDVSGHDYETVRSGEEEPATEATLNGSGFTPSGTRAGEASDDSSYPDPSVFTQRIGMGYYEQDDTPDKILFDPYQAPPTNSFRFTEPEVSEVVKKSIRAAKRKAKRENEDPDFVVGKSQQKRPRISHDPDALEHMDPALFGEPSATVEDETENTASSVGGHDDEQNGLPSSHPVATDQPEDQSRRRIMPRFDANEPELRHAKPLTSYVEDEDAELDETEHGGVEKPVNQTTDPLDEPTDPENTERSALDMATESIHSLLGIPQRQETTTITPGAASTSSGKRRGRPPKQPRVSNVSKPAIENPQTNTSRADDAVPKRRPGRPKKSSLATVVSANNDTTVPRENVGKTAAPSTRRGRSAWTAVNRRRSLSKEETMPPREKRITRANIQVAESEPLKSHPGKPVATQFMSLAERMALRGKKFKIGKRKNKSKDNSVDVGHSQSPAPQPVPLRTENVQNSSASEDNESAYQTPQPDSKAETPASSHGISRRSTSYESFEDYTGDYHETRSTGPTVIRLGDIHSDSETGDAGGGAPAGGTPHSLTDESSDDDDDSDIPAQRPTSVNTSRDDDMLVSRSGAGRGRARGRGRSRGRGRGRPRGRRGA